MSDVGEGEKLFCNLWNGDNVLFPLKNRNFKRGGKSLL